MRSCMLYMHQLLQHSILLAACSLQYTKLALRLSSSRSIHFCYTGVNAIFTSAGRLLRRPLHSLANVNTNLEPDAVDRN